MQIREYNVSDAEMVVKLFVQTVHSVNAKHYTAAQLDAWAPDTLEAASWCAPLAQSYTLVALAGNQLVGFGNLLASDYLDRLYVHRDFQRQGIATDIASRLEQQARLLGLHKLKTDASVTAVPFFENRGYVTVRANAVPRRGELLTNYTMEKQL